MPRGKLVYLRGLPGGTLVYLRGLPGRPLSRGQDWSYYSERAAPQDICIYSILLLFLCNPDRKEVHTESWHTGGGSRWYRYISDRGLSGRGRTGCLQVSQPLASPGRAPLKLTTKLPSQ